MVDKAKKRQSKTEIEEEKEFQQIAKEEKKAKRQNGIMRIAMLEDKMAAEDQNANSAHPLYLSKFFFPSSPSHGLWKYFNLGDTTQEMGPTEGNSEAQEPPRKKRAIKDKKEGSYYKVGWW